jgi:sugar phosphate isomerase/epimerase
MTISRRSFIKKTGLAIGSAAFLNSFSNIGSFSSKGVKTKLTKSFGFQVWHIREELAEDTEATLKAMAKLGYKEVEMCSPLSYAEWGLEPLNKFSGMELRKMIEDSGLTCTSCHYDINELRDSFNDRMEWTQQMDLKQMILAQFSFANDKLSMDDFRKAADELNMMGEKTKAEGIQVGYHNHDHEFQKLGKELIYDILMAQFDPELVKMQFHVAVIKLGYKAADYFKKYPGRYISAHVSGWSAEQEKKVPVGQGDVDWKEFFKAAEIGGVKNIFVEVPPDMFEPSARFLLNF